MAATILLCGAVAVFVVRFPALALLLVIAGLWLRVPTLRPGTAYGSASYANLTELVCSGFLDGTGLILGRLAYANKPSRRDAIGILWSLRYPSETAMRLWMATFWESKRTDNSILRISRFTHLATFAGAGRGKGVSIVIPNVLSYVLSMVIVDIKAEIFHLTAEHRRRRFGHRIVVLDPFGLSGRPSDVLNPLDAIDAHQPDFLPRCRDLAEALVLVVGTEPDPHWNENAKLILCAFIAFVCACEPDRSRRSLRTVRQLVASHQRYFTSLSMMQQTEGFGGVISELGHQLTVIQGEELSSVLSVVQRHIAWMDSPAVASVFAGPSTFSPGELRSGRMTVYLILPPAFLSSHIGLMRLWINTLLRETTWGLPDERFPILFMLDEFGHCGHLQAVEDAVTLMRGYGIRLWFIWQSIGQVRTNFGDRANVVLDNIDTQIYFGINSFESADAVSKRGGDATILTGSMNRSWSRSRPNRYSGHDGGSASESTSYTLSPLGRAVIRADEVIRLPEGMAIAFHKNLPMLLIRLLRYYDAPEFRRGGTGRSRSTGLYALFVSLLALGLSLCFASAAVFSPRPAVATQPAASPAFPAPSPVFNAKSGLPTRPVPYRLPGYGPSPVQRRPAVPPAGLYPPRRPSARQGVRRGYP